MRCYKISRKIIFLLSLLLGSVVLLSAAFTIAPTVVGQVPVPMSDLATTDDGQELARSFDLICDDGDSCFSYNGGWNPPSNPNQYCKYAGDMRFGYACWAAADCQPDNDHYSVFWRPNQVSGFISGNYGVFAYIPRCDSGTPHTQSAKYYLRHAGDSAASAPLIATVNQAHPYQDNNDCSGGARWVSLGTHHFDSNTYIELRAWTDESGPQWGTRHHVIFADAIKFSYNAPAPTSTPVPTSTPTRTPTPGIDVIVDDGSPGFSFNGGWSPPTNPNQHCKYDGDMRFGYACYSSSNCRSNTDAYSVFWRPFVSKPGNYEVFAYIPKCDSSTPHTRSAKYYLRRQGDTAARAPLIATVDQARVQGYSCSPGSPAQVSLGTHYFDAGTYVELRAWTNESATHWGHKHHVIFADAMRFHFIGSSTPPPPPPPPPLPPSKPPVVLVHGFNGNSDSFGGMASWLAADGYHTEYADLLTGY